jgi:hypothetical protein
MRKEISESFLFHARLTRMRCHIFVTVLRINWTEKWLGDGSTEVDQLLGFLCRQI